MKVLFLNQARGLSADMVSDYQADMVFHGLSVLDGVDCIESSPMWHMRKGEKTRDPELFKHIWGKGFTMYGLLPDIDLQAPVPDVTTADKVIVPIHHTLAQRPGEIIKHLMMIKEVIPRAKMCVIDGWDRTDIDNSLLSYCKHMGHKYFKRECTFTDETVKPISFAFPEEMMQESQKNVPQFDIAPLIPVNQSIDPSYMSTYIYDDQQAYYDMYNDSYFALTSKKGGWDTLRHYEIMANHAIPIFVDIENCPEHTLWNFPKHLCKEANFLTGLRLNLTNGQTWNPGMVLPHCGVVDKDKPGEWKGHWGTYYDLLIKFDNYFKENLLTKHLATYVLETMDENH
jgi:hypothetical protein